MVDVEKSIQALYIDIWSVIALIAEDYPEINKEQLKTLVNITIPKL